MPSISRRRILIAGAAAGLTLAGGLPLAGARASTPPLRRWRGSALGAEAEIALLHPDEATAWHLIAGCLDEIERLEKVFSLYRVDSALTALNRDGRLDAPPLELVALLGEALGLAELSGGAFDPTVQPLFQLYAQHFAAADADPEGPAAARVAAVRERVDYRQVALDPDRIGFGRAGMAITLNGIAQGYITDRIAERLRAGAIDDVLVSLGEIRALGRAADGGPWRAGIADPRQPAALLRKVALGEAPGELPALATSGGYGTPFDGRGRYHHLLDPRSGASAHHHASVSVAAATATRADGLSTALSVLTQAEGARLLESFAEARVWYA